MAKYKVHVNRPAKVIYVLPDADAAPANTVVAGTFDHEGDIEATDKLESSVNHVIFHHVQEIMYHRSDANPANAAMFPNNITDLQNYSIRTTVG